MKTLTVIPAKTKSKRLPYKNYRTIMDKTLLQYAIDSAALIPNNDIKIITDNPTADNHIMTKEVANTSQLIPLALDAINYKPDIICMLLPTSPERTAQQVMQAYDLHLEKKETVVGVIDTGLRAAQIRLLTGNNIINIHSVEVPSEQDMAVYATNGSLYITSYDIFIKRRFAGTALPFVTSRLIPDKMIDINTIEEFNNAEENIINRCLDA